MDIILQENDSVEILKAIKITANNCSVIMLYNQVDAYKEEKYRLLEVDFLCDLYHNHQKIPCVIDIIAANEKGYTLNNNNYEN